MLEESLPSIWASMYSWFTPTVLFILINVVIGTIAFSSSVHKQEDGRKRDPRPLSRTSSVLERLRSISLYRQNTQELTPLTATIDPQPLQTVETVGLQEPRRSTGTVSATDLTGEKEPGEADLQPEETFEASEFEDVSHFARSRSDTRPTAGETTEKLTQKMKKSASAKSAFGHFREKEIVEAVQRPATTRERKVVGADEEVDAKADDFINKFRQQLKLQRLDSIIRYKEMLNRGK